MESRALSENENADLHSGNVSNKAVCDKKMAGSSSLVSSKELNHHSPELTTASNQKVTKNRKKSDCNVQHVLKALNSLTTPEEKLAAMCQKYADLFDENRKLQSSVKQFEKQISNAVKERDQTRTDLSKSILSRSRLENLCRELQRQNKEIKEESSQKIQEEEDKRKEVSAKFQTTLNEITELMKEDNDKTMKLRDDNIDMTSKLKSIYEQYEIREQQIEKMAKQMALEAQLYEARLAKLEMETSAEKELLLREKQQLLVTLTEYQAKFQEYQNIEVALRNQVAMYNNKYEEFEKSLTRSNKMFSGFKEEMENMSYKIVKLESETLAWKQRWEKTQKALVEMAAEKQKCDQEVILAAKQMATLHKLCRTLQVERAQLLNKSKELGSVPDSDKFVAVLENVLADNPIDTTPINSTKEAAKNNDSFPEGNQIDTNEHRNNQLSDQSKSKREKITQKADRLSVQDPCETLASTIVDQSQSPPTSNLELETVELTSCLESNIIDVISLSKDAIPSQLNGSFSETDESLKAELSSLQKDNESDNSVLQKSTRNSKVNKNSPKKKNKK